MAASTSTRASRRRVITAQQVLQRLAQWDTDTEEDDSDNNINSGSDMDVDNDSNYSDTTMDDSVADIM